MGDPLSDVLRTVRLTGAVFFHVEGAPPWVAESPEGRLIARSVMSGVQHLVSYHIVTRGSCWAGLPDEQPVHLVAGDIIVFPTVTVMSCRASPECARNRDSRNTLSRRASIARAEASPTLMPASFPGPSGRRARWCVYALSIRVRRAGISATRTCHADNACGKRHRHYEGKHEAVDW